MAIFNGGRPVLRPAATDHADSARPPVRAGTATPPRDAPGPAGEIRGALGRVSSHGPPPRSSGGRRLLALLAIMGPGLIVMIGDNDAGGVTTYAQAGQSYGVSLLWVLLPLTVILYVAQEMVARLGAVTGTGHGTLIRERFGRFWAAFSVFDLLLLNFLTLLTEFIGIRAAMSYFGVSPYLSVPVTAVVLTGIMITGALHRWERAMYALIVVSMLVFPLLALAPVHWGAVVGGTFEPGVRGGLSSTAMIFIIGMVGTTIAPWQLFFQQGTVVDKKIGTRWLNYERVDTFAGSLLTNVAAFAIIVAAAFAFGASVRPGTTSGALGIAHGLERALGPVAGAIFAIVLIEAALIGAATVTLSTAYAFGELFNFRTTLSATPRSAKGFFATYLASVVLAGGIVLVPRLPLGLINLGVQDLAGVLLPSALGFLVLMCSDRELMGPWANSPWVNTLAALIVGVLLQLSLVLTVTSLAPSAPVPVVTAATGAAVIVAVAAVAVGQRRKTGRWRADPVDLARRRGWRTPGEVLLRRMPMTAGRRVALYALRGYLLVAVALTVVSFARLAG